MEHPRTIADRPRLSGSAGGTVLTAFARAFRTPDLRKKMLFTLGIIALFRLGSVRPDPGCALPRTISTLYHPGQAGDAGNVYGLVQPVLRRRAAAAVGLRARHHAVHHREHHPAAARRGHPALRALKKEGQAGTDQDHPVHPVPDHRLGDPAVDRPSSRWPGAASCSRSCRDGQILLDTDNVFAIVIMVLTMTAGTAVDHVAG